MLLSGKSLGRTSERRFDTSLAVLQKKCTIALKSARETGSEKSGCPFFAVLRRHFFSGNNFVEPSPPRWLLLQMNEGWVKLHRSLQDHPRANNPHWMCLWIHLLLLATHKPIRMVFAGKILDLKPGQFITSRLSLSAKTGLHRSMIDRLLQIMIFEHQIEQQTSNVSRLITILNWDKYQQVEPRIEQQLSHDRATGEQPASTNKNVKNEENEKNGRISTHEFALSGDDPKPKSKARGTLDEVLLYAAHLGLTEDDGRWFFEKCEGCGWKNGRGLIQNFEMTMSSWKRQGYYPSQKPIYHNGKPSLKADHEKGF